MGKILLVEDDEVIRELYERQLKKAGFEVETAPNGQTGLEMTKAKNYDLVLLDMMMPVMNGIEMLRKMKERGDLSPVVFLTNLGQESIMEEGKKLGAISYIIKASYPPKELIVEIKQIFEKIKTGSITANTINI
jgi:DNA-binding response OmpR family regulator